MTDRTFVSHLARGGELLRADKLPEAVDELRQALSLRPGEAKVLNLLGLATFRLGRFPEACEIFKDLAKRQPKDAPMRLNLGLVHLKLGQVDDAIRELLRAKELDSTQVRTLGYLGLAYARKGEFAHARDAFRAAGQEDLAREMEEQLRAPPPGDAVPRPVADIVTSRVVAHPARNAATDDMVTPVPEEPEPPRTPMPTPTPTQAPTPTETAAEAEPPPLPEPPPPPPTPAELVPAPSSSSDGVRIAPISLAALTAARLVRPDAGDLPLETGPGGTLVVRVRGKIMCRREGVLARGGDLAFTPAMRRTRGRITQEAFVGMFLVSGNGHLVAAARGGAFTSVALAGDVLYLREHVVYAFEERLGWENGQVPGSALAVLQLRGEGCVAIHNKHASIAIEIREGRSLAVPPESLVGWSGRVVPRLITEAGAPRVECAGDGVVLVEEPSA